MAADETTSGRGRIRIALACEVCGERNYKTTIARREGSQPLRLKKYCKTCERHTLHKESK
ncbi:MAG: 50S ribosomal protein L33 [Polyangiaceae bacterium]